MPLRQRIITTFPVVIDLASRVSVPRDLSLRTEFDAIPDVPVESFQLNLVAGRRGTIGLVGNACAPRTRRRSLAQVDFRAQSGQLIQRRTRLRVDGCPSSAASMGRDNARAAARSARASR